MENNINIKPHITEKSFALANAFNKYTFLSDGGANKIEVKKFVEMEYKVEVLDVKSITKPGKMKTNWKNNKKFRKEDQTKYIVELKKGDKIDEFFSI